MCEFPLAVQQFLCLLHHLGVWLTGLRLHNRTFSKETLASEVLPFSQ